MIVFTVQNPRHKCDLGNKNDYRQENNCRQYLIVILINKIIILRLYYICVCALQLTPQVLPRVYNS